MLVITSQGFISTRCGKTTVCQMLALLNHLKLHMLNCHMHSDTADFIGSLRPVRDGKVGSDFAFLDNTLICQKCHFNISYIDHQAVH